MFYESVKMNYVVFCLLQYGLHIFEMIDVYSSLYGGKEFYSEGVTLVPNDVQ